jgi:hypothetical protein
MMLLRLGENVALRTSLLAAALIQVKMHDRAFIRGRQPGVIKIGHTSSP